MRQLSIYFFTAFMAIFFLYTQDADAQISEPPVLETPRNISSLPELYSSGLGLNVQMNNFGFGIGGDYRRVLGNQTELTVSLRLTSISDDSEQTFNDVFFGQQIVPNKFQRAFGAPLLIGLRYRLLPDLIQEDYRFFVSAAIGPSAGLTIPYFDDINNNGFREQFQNFFEPVNDIFSGWSEGEFHWGGAGEFKIGVDIGSNFARLSSVEFGYYFYYYPDGLQIMMPNQPIRRENIRPGEFPFELQPNGELALKPFFEPERFFGTPQISFVFGRLW